jgi:hypothetical protein
MINEPENLPECFGHLDQVFPEGENGLRQSPEECMTCAHKTDCLKAAITRDGGLKVKEEKVDRAWQAGRISFFQRWVRKQSFQRDRQKSNHGDKSP